VLLRFGIYKGNPRKDSGKDGKKKFDLELLKKHKTVYDIKFVDDISTLSADSTEFDCITSSGKNIKV
jgi:hypothetical protein